MHDTLNRQNNKNNHQNQNQNQNQKPSLANLNISEITSCENIENIPNRDHHHHRARTEICLLQKGDLGQVNKNTNKNNNINKSLETETRKKPAKKREINKNKQKDNKNDKNNKNDEIIISFCTESSKKLTHIFNTIEETHLQYTKFKNFIENSFTTGLGVNNSKNINDKRVRYSVKDIAFSLSIIVSDPVYKNPIFF